MDMQKGSQPIDAYLRHAKSLADSLAAINELDSPKELVIAVLRGLGPGYKMLVTAVLNFPSLPDFADLHTCLLAFIAQPPNSIWYPDTSAIHHMTGSPSNLQNQQPYQDDFSSYSWIYPMHCKNEATIHIEWRDAMTEEINALLKNHTWSLVPSSPSQNLVGCKWVFRIKHHSDGFIERYKARLVAKGFHQHSGIDYTETFNPIIKPTIIRTILNLAISCGWSLRQLDVKNAFLYGFLQEDVYMSQPHGFIDPTRPSYVCKLHKALYGLKKAPRAWFHHISGHFDIKDLGPLNYFLGLQVLHKDGTLHINQLKYAHDLLHKANLLNSKPASTPLAAKVLLSVFNGALISNPTEYCKLIGSLEYRTLTCPDISFAVNTVAQFMSAPRTSHLVATKRILRYIKGTNDLSLTFTPQIAAARLSAYSDVDWAGCLDSRRSITRYVITLGTNLISWCSKKQPTISCSSTESEYRALSYTCAETTRLCSLLHKLGVHLWFPVQLFCDNLNTRYIAANPVFHARTCHIELDYHFVCEKVALRSRQVCFVPFVDQPADLFTKALHKPRHQHMSSKLVHPVTPNLRSGRMGGC
ncbi:unnamed protein product [Prunus armeniaca]